MDEDLKKTIHACIAASVPCIAISTTETAEITKQISEYAAKYSHQLRGQQKRRRVFVWRESVGFEEYAIYSKTDGEESIVEVLDNSSKNFSAKKVPNAVYGPDDDFVGASVPFAVDFISRYNAKEEGRGAIFVLRDWHRYIEVNGDHVDRQLGVFEALTAGGAHAEKTVVILSPTRWNAESIPVELNQHIYQMSFDMPTKAERLHRATTMTEQLSTSGNWEEVAALKEKDIEDIADATAGLTRTQLENVLCMSLVTHRTLDVDYILTEKKKLVEQAGFIMTRPATGFSAIGGLTPLKEWASRLRKRFTKAAREYGFPRFPRGLLMAGVPGCGKSAISKALANEWNMNLLTVQATDLKGSLVGESEAKVHSLLNTARAAAPIIVFVDEAEKLLGKSEGIHDGGAHDAVLGQFLSFMQDDDSGVFFVFTANNMEKFAPELVDRFEGRFFIDLPTASERKEILKIHLALRKQDVEKYDLDDLVRAAKDFSGRNIEDSIEEAMSIAFDEDRALEMKDLLEVFSTIVPTSKTKRQEIETMRSFVENGMMRQANDAVAGESADDDGGGGIRNFV